MFLFYALHKLAFATPENALWSATYFEPGWQAFFDMFNSLPLIALAVVVAAAAGRRSWVIVLGSMALHVAMDLPVHHDDGHRHFFPFSDWRFASPVSYWDPEHYGRIVGTAEAVFVVAGAGWLVVTARPRPAKVAAAVCATAYIVFLFFALLVWAPRA